MSPVESELCEFEKFFFGKTCVVNYGFRDTSAQVFSSVHGDGYDIFSLWIVERVM